MGLFPDDRYSASASGSWPSLARSRPSGRRPCGRITSSVPRKTSAAFVASSIAMVQIQQPLGVPRWEGRSPPVVVLARGGGEWQPHLSAVGRPRRRRLIIVQGGHRGGRGAAGAGTSVRRRGPEIARRHPRSPRDRRHARQAEHGEGHGRALRPRARGRFSCSSVTTTNARSGCCAPFASRRCSSASRRTSTLPRPTPSYLAAESQVFRPERRLFDEIVTRKLLPALGGVGYVFRSNPIAIKDVTAADRSPRSGGRPARHRPRKRRRSAQQGGRARAAVPVFGYACAVTSRAIDCTGRSREPALPGEDLAAPAALHAGVPLHADPGMSALLWLKLAAVALALAIVAAALWWTYAEGKSAGRNEVSTQAMEKAAEKTHEGIRLRNQAARSRCWRRRRHCFRAHAPPRP